MLLKKIIFSKYLFPIFCSKKLSNMSGKNNIAVFQMSVTSNKEANFQQFLELHKKIKSKEIQMIFLPEACDYIGDNKEQTISNAEEITGPFIKRFQKFAKDNLLWISIGGFHEKSNEGKNFNTHVIINNFGEIIARYRKIHLFDISLPEKNFSSLESSYTSAGTQIITPVHTPVGNVGMAVCYDLRFPAMSSLLRNFGADILTYPSAFSIPTGLVHWHILLQARAIETQCYVVAAAQVGQHNSKRASFGHSLVVDPWGKIIAECVNNIPDILLASIDLSYLQECRRNMPVAEHCRPDIYNQVKQQDIDAQTEYLFGDNRIIKETIFFKSSQSFAFVNRKPVLPGHVLVSSLRPVARFANLRSDEVADIFKVVQEVAKVLEVKYTATAITIAVQDGAHAGQTVPHVHVHILPRQKNDLPRNDDIYDKLENHDKLETNFRSLEDMTKEANELKLLFK